MRKSFIFQVLVIFQALFLSACLFEGDENKHDLERQFLPSVHVQNMLGEALDLGFSNMEKPALVNVWATWCTPCIQEMPALDDVAAKGEFEVYAISTDAKLDVVTKYIDRHKFEHLNIYFDGFGKQTRELWQAHRLPVTFVLNPKGKVLDVIYGEKPWDDDAYYTSVKKRYGFDG